jgi:hypothetical protein
LRKAAWQAVGSGPLARAHVIASTVFDWYLGPEWLQKLSTGTSHSLLFRKATTREHLLLRFDRLLNLGEMLFNLRDVGGIEEVIAQLQQQQTESAFAKLEAGSILVSHDIKFNFVGPRGDTNHDLELVFPEGMVGCSETKSKLELREFSYKSIEEELRRACSQLPADMPGIIFVRVPNEWLHTNDRLRNRYEANPHGDPSSLRFQLGEVARSFIRRNRRVVVVEFYSDRMWFGGDTITEATGGLEMTSICHQFDQAKSWQLLTARADDGGATAPNWWVSLLALAGGKLDNELKLDRLIPTDQLHVYRMEPSLPNWASNDP